MGREKRWTLMHLKREDNAIKAIYTLLSISRRESAQLA